MSMLDRGVVDVGGVAFEWPSEVLQRVPMSFEEWQELPGEVRAEWVDGVALVSPPPAVRHQYVGKRLMACFDRGLPDLIVVHEVGVRTSRRHYRVPDVTVMRDWPEDPVWVTEAPVIVAEVLSTATRREDQLRKTGEYLTAGMGQYWVVDPEHGELTVLRAVADGDVMAWEIVLELGPEHRVGEVAVGEYGTVAVELDALFGQ